MYSLISHLGLEDASLTMLRLRLKLFPDYPLRLLNFCVSAGTGICFEEQLDRTIGGPIVPQEHQRTRRRVCRVFISDDMGVQSVCLVKGIHRLLVLMELVICNGKLPVDDRHLLAFGRLIKVTNGLRKSTLHQHNGADSAISVRI